jgi:hypothetical protein
VSFTRAGAIVAALALLAGCGGGSSRTEHGTPPTAPVALIATPAWGLAACGAVPELRSICPTRVPLTRSRQWTMIFHAPTQRFPLALLELESGIVYGGFRERVHRPPILGTTVVLGGELMHLEARAFPGPRARLHAVRNGMANGLRRGPIALGPRAWAGLHGELSLTPSTYAAQGELTDLVVFRWRDGAGDHAVGVNVWEPLTEAVAALRTIVSTLAPAPRGTKARPAGSVDGTPMTTTPSWLAALCAAPTMLRLACPTRVPAGTSEGAYVTIQPSPPSEEPRVTSVTVSIEAPTIPTRTRPQPPWHLELTAGFRSRTRRFARPRPLTRITVPPDYLVTAPVPLGRRDWTTAPGSLVFGDCFGNHLCYRWRQGGRGYQIDLHAWDPVTQTARVLRAIVRSTPAGCR